MENEAKKANFRELPLKAINPYFTYAFLVQHVCFSVKVEHPFVFKMFKKCRRRD